MVMKGTSLQPRFPRVCRSCGQDFLAKDAKGNLCYDCRERVDTLCGCGCKTPLQIAKWYLAKRGGRVFARGHGMKGQTYEQLWPGQKPRCGFKKGLANIAKRADVRAKISQRQREPGRHGKHRYPEKFAGGHLPTFVSKIEQEFGKYLSPGFVPQYRISRFIVDYANPINKIAIDFQGCYWHHCRQCFPDKEPGTIQRQTIHSDARRWFFIPSRGWKYYRVWEHEFKAFLEEHRYAKEIRDYPGDWNRCSAPSPAPRQ